MATLLNTHNIENALLQELNHEGKLSTADHILVKNYEWSQLKVNVELVGDNNFLFVSVLLGSNSLISEVNEISKLVRKVMENVDSGLIALEKWGAGIFINGKICHIVYPGNSE